jgi:hypothetical protein
MPPDRLVDVLDCDFADTRGVYGGTSHRINSLLTLQIPGAQTVNYQNGLLKPPLLISVYPSSYVAFTNDQ